jgi:hypothetical protein
MINMGTKIHNFSLPSVSVDARQRRNLLLVGGFGASIAGGGLAASKLARDRYDRLEAEGKLGKTSEAQKEANKNAVGNIYGTYGAAGGALAYPLALDAVDHLRSRFRTGAFMKRKNTYMDFSNPCEKHSKDKITK